MLQKLADRLPVGRIGHAMAYRFGVTVKAVAAKNPVQRQRQPGKGSQRNGPGDCALRGSDAGHGVNRRQCAREMNHSRQRGDQPDEIMSKHQRLFLKMEPEMGIMPDIRRLRFPIRPGNTGLRRNPGYSIVYLGNFQKNLIIRKI